MFEPYVKFHHYRDNCNGDTGIANLMDGNPCISELAIAFL